ncbi:MAG: glycine cleavage system aminomethyltransferase GcvT [Bacteroidales bacterium]|jgi:aminomethyltransferase|nr:glycine cleavage system aminomethyltransferase GcvT [Bacteroidales bacterium]
MEEVLKQTAFKELVEKAGGKMVPFAGFIMPVQFEGIGIEHETVRNAVGVFDVSHMGEFWVKGPNAAAFIQRITTNNVNDLYDGRVQYSCFPNGKGGIVDDLLVYRFKEDLFFLVVNASNIDKDYNWCVQHAAEFNIIPGKDLVNVSDEYCQLAVQGPLALKAMQKLTGEPIEDMEYYHCKIMEFAGIKDAIFSTTGYTGSGGCEIYVKNEHAEKLWNAVFEAGAEYGIKPIGLGARDTLRLESGFCLYGNDIDDTTSPLEAGLGWITKFTDDNDFIDKDKMLKLKADGIKKRLKGFILEERGVPRQHYEICNEKGEVIGEVTSGTMSPMLKVGIGLGYVADEYSKLGTEIYIKVRDKLLKAKIVKTPFWNR